MSCHDNVIVTLIVPATAMIQDSKLNHVDNIVCCHCTIIISVVTTLSMALCTEDDCACLLPVAGEATVPTT